MSEKKHVVQCPSCGKDVLDHMTECPFCHGTLQPRGYTPMSEEKIKRVRRVTNIIGFIIAAIVFFFLVVKPRLPQ